MTMNFKSIFFGAICMCHFIALSAQGSFAPIGAKWHYYWMCSEQQDIIYNCPVYTLESIKDTVINNQECRVITTDLPYIPDDLFVYGDHDSIFMLDTLINEFVKIYDFTLDPNDSIIIKDSNVTFHGLISNGFSSVPYGPIIMKVDSVDTIYINGNLHIRQYTSAPEFADYEYNGTSGFNVSGIGTTDLVWPFSSTTQFPETTIRGGLICYEDGKLSYNPWSNPRCDSLNTFIDDQHRNMIKPPKVFPNPISDQLHIFLNGNKADLIRIHDLYGRTIHKYDLSNTEQEISFQVGALTKGYYLIQFYENNKLLHVSKIIKK